MGEVLQEGMGILVVLSWDMKGFDRVSAQPTYVLAPFIVFATPCQQGSEIQNLSF